MTYTDNEFIELLPQESNWISLESNYYHSIISIKNLNFPEKTFLIGKATNSEHYRIKSASAW